jgi:hypothetical protein
MKTNIDPAVEKSGVVDNQEAWAVIHDRAALQFELPSKNIRADVLSGYIDTHNATKPDIWAAREVTLNAKENLTPVLVGIWDSGVDVSILETRYSPTLILPLAGLTDWRSRTMVARRPRGFNLFLPRSNCNTLTLAPNSRAVAT